MELADRMAAAHACFALAVAERDGLPELATLRERRAAAVARLGPADGPMAPLA